MTRRVSIRESNNQNNEKQYDDDGRRRDHYRARAARQIVLHLPRLLGGLLQVLSPQSGRRRLGPVERETGLRCDLAHFRALQQGPDCLVVRLFLADALLDGLVERGPADYVVLALAVGAMNKTERQTASELRTILI